MRLPDFSAIAPGALSAAQRVDPAPAPRGGAFRMLMREVDADVRHFITHGGQSGTTAHDLRPEAAWQRLQHNAAPQPAEASTAASATSLQAGQAAFLSHIAPWASEAARALGVSPALVSAHAALESDWGRRPVEQDDGRDTHNLFGIKAGSRWRGESAAARTTEYIDGHATATTERFRAYPDLGSAFQDYVRLLRDNPRYAGALRTGSDAGAFAQGLVRGGYATDPNYAHKLERVATQIQRAVE